MSSGVLSPGFIRQGVGVWKRTFAAARRCGDRLAHTALIPGGLERGCFAATERGSERQRHRPRVTASGTVDWERPFQEEVFLCGTTPAGEAIIQREVGKPKETEVIIIDSETGDELRTHSRNFPRPNEARGVFAPRAGAYPEEY